jgi:tetratricopeptide (TPR) repeat protein
VCVVAGALVLGGTQAIAQQGSDSKSGGSSQSTTSTSNPNDVPTPDDVPAATNSQTQNGAASAQGGQQGDQQNGDDKPSRAQRAKKHVKDQMSSWCVGAPLNHCYEKQPKDDSQKGSGLPPPPRSDDKTATPPAKEGESSSKDTKVDLSPPLGDSNEHPESTPGPDSGPAEFHAWDPHRAMKNIEIGDYYYKQQNYRAALSRYQEALQWKPKDAEATFKLADAFEKLGDTIDAKDNYQKYLAILPKGPRSEEANKALARLTK